VNDPGGILQVRQMLALLGGFMIALIGLLAAVVAQL
jgi:hypothetical protein